MKNLFDNAAFRATIIGVAAIICSVIISVAVKSIRPSDSTVMVTGLGETEMCSDWIAWQGTITSDAYDRADCYAKLEKSRVRVEEYLEKRGIAKDRYTFNATTIEEREESAYANGSYIGQRFAGYRMKQRFEIQSEDIDLVEDISRDITSLISSGVCIESYAPKFYLKNIKDLKLSLIDDATANALVRAKKLTNGFAKIKDIKNIDVGVFQITGLYGNDDFSGGGTFNTSDKMKKVSVTVHATYGIK